MYRLPPTMETSTAILHRLKKGISSGKRCFIKKKLVVRKMLKKCHSSCRNFRINSYSSCARIEVIKFISSINITEEWIFTIWHGNYWYKNNLMYVRYKKDHLINFSTLWYYLYHNNSMFIMNNVIRLREISVMCFIYNVGTYYAFPTFLSFSWKWDIELWILVSQAVLSWDKWIISRIKHFFY